MALRLRDLKFEEKSIRLERVYQFDLSIFSKVTCYKLHDMSYGTFLISRDRKPEYEISVFDHSNNYTKELRAIVARKKLNYEDVLNPIVKAIDPKLHCGFKGVNIFSYISNKTTEFELKSATIEDFWELLNENEQNEILKKL